MSGRLILGVCLALLPTLAGAVEEPDPLHDPVPQPGVHPRLMFRAGAEPSYPAAAPRCRTAVRHPGALACRPAHCSPAPRHSVSQVGRREG